MELCFWCAGKWSAGPFFIIYSPFLSVPLLVWHMQIFYLQPSADNAQKNRHIELHKSHPQSEHRATVLCLKLSCEWRVVDLVRYCALKKRTTIERLVVDMHKIISSTLFLSARYIWIELPIAPLGRQPSAMQLLSWSLNCDPIGFKTLVFCHLSVKLILDFL